MPGATNGTRVIALVGPAGAGKTSLAEAFLYASGTTDRQGSTSNKSSIGDSSEEARSRGGSTETNLYNLRIMDRKRDALLSALRAIFVPTVPDWEALALPASLHPLYYAFRPLRLSSIYLRRLTRNV